MFKFKKLIKIVAGIILINLIACDSFKNSLDISNTNSVISSKTINTSNISSDLIALPKKTKSKLEAHISSSAKNTLADYYNESYIDSLRSILIETGSLKINVFESFLIDYIKSNSLSDTTYLANLYLNSPVKAENISFSYDVKKDDILFYEIKNTKSNTLKKIEITEGETVRFLKNNLKKKETVKGEIKINADNILTLTISNDNFIKNKGLFKSKLKFEYKRIYIDQFYWIIPSSYLLLYNVSDL